MKKVVFFLVIAAFVIMTSSNIAEITVNKAITLSSQDYRELKTGMSFFWQDVQKQLKPDEVVIEFIYLNENDTNSTGSIVYAALVLRTDMETPVRVTLCEQKQLEAILQSTPLGVQQKTEMLYVEKGEKLYQLIFKSLEKELTNVKTIYYSTSGLLNYIAFDALPTEKEKILLSDKFDLRLVSNIREIERMKRETSFTLLQDTVVIFGGLTYDRMIDTVQHNNQPDSQTLTPSNPFIDRFKQRNTELPETDSPNSKPYNSFSSWTYLPGTKVETEQIVSLLESRHIPYKYYTESQGTEESFKQLSGTNSVVIHVATHSFFIPDINHKSLTDLVQHLGGEKNNPMLCAGLIMSNANYQWIVKEYDIENDKEDGIFTADEIAHLNLRKTKLVVLSGSETGLGYIKGIEEIYGLQRAFKSAGVESLIMSLWAVPDDATVELMTQFYREWLSGQNRREAFKAANQKIREKFKSPYYWAAFVMMD